MQDQAEKLREMVRRLRVDVPATEGSGVRRRVCRRVAVTSGKGGVGKTNLSVNLAIALSRKGLRVLLVDADLGLANVDVMLGIIPQYTLAHVVQGQRRLEEVILEGPEGVRLVASGSGGVQELAEMGESQRARFLQSLEGLEADVDVLLIDTGAGIHRNVLSFALAADEVLLVTTPEPTALMDAYGMIKVLHRERPDVHIRLTVNQAGSAAEADEAARKLVVLARRFLGFEIEVLAHLPRDTGVWQAVKRQRPVLLSAPASPFASAVQRLADSLTAGSGAGEAGAVGQFFRRVAQLFAGKGYG